ERSSADQGRAGSVWQPDEPGWRAAVVRAAEGHVRACTFEAQHPVGKHVSRREPGDGARGHQHVLGPDREHDGLTDGPLARERDRNLGATVEKYARYATRLVVGRHAPLEEVLDPRRRRLGEPRRGVEVEGPAQG